MTPFIRSDILLHLVVPVVTYNILQFDNKYVQHIL